MYYSGETASGAGAAQPVFSA
uniref:Uncharacterized protein n=1 Tax=Anguilla anguilla TaxID=7936 RepID=A0A0E9SNR6_ANGAN